MEIISKTLVFFFIALSPFLVFHVAAQGLKLDKTDKSDHQRQHNPHGIGIPVLKPLKRVLIQIVHYGSRPIIRSAGGKELNQ